MSEGIPTAVVSLINDARRKTWSALRSLAGNPICNIIRKEVIAGVPEKGIPEQITEIKLESIALLAQFFSGIQELDLAAGLLTYSQARFVFYSISIAGSEIFDGCLALSDEIEYPIEEKRYRVKKVEYRPDLKRSIVWAEEA